MSKLRAIKGIGFGPLPLLRWWNMAIQKTREVISRSAVKPLVAPFAKSAETNPEIITPSLEKNWKKKKYGAMAPRTAKTRYVRFIIAPSTRPGDPREPSLSRFLFPNQNGFWPSAGRVACGHGGRLPPLSRRRRTGSFDSCLIFAH